eukprot:SAG11_NODE_752_length_7351_cov_4.119691_3_plen_176_part_00
MLCFEPQLQDASELSELMSGRERGISLADVSAWEACTGYQNGFDATHRTVALFWEVVRLELDSLERAALLGFATGCPRLPAGGFSRLQLGQAAAHNAVTGDDGGDGGGGGGGGGGTNSSSRRFFLRRVHPAPSSLLPTASVCANVLLLPEFEERAVLVERLRYALRYGGVGFGMH